MRTKIDIRWIYTARVDAFRRKVGVVKAPTEEIARFEIYRTLKGELVSIDTLREIYNPEYEDLLNKKHGIKKDFI